MMRTHVTDRLQMNDNKSNEKYYKNTTSSVRFNYGTHKQIR